MLDDFLLLRPGVDVEDGVVGIRAGVQDDPAVGNDFLGGGDLFFAEFKGGNGMRDFFELGRRE